MTHLDQIVRENIPRLWSSRLLLMKKEGFDFDLSLEVEAGSYENDYTPGDKDYIDLIINELNLNAFKAIYGVSDARREGDREKSKQIHGCIEVKLSQTDQSYVLSVTDNGDGISEENKGRVFENGFSTRGTTGIGLGLVLNRAYLLGGTIRFESEVGKGSTFYLELPKQNPV